MLRAMDRKIIARTLELAEERVLEGDRLIAHQKELIDQMLKLDVDVSVYREALARFEQNQTLRVQRVCTLKQNLAAASGPTSSPSPAAG
jgi:hypothetical protein